MKVCYKVGIEADEYAVSLVVNERWFNSSSGLNLASGHDVSLVIVGAPIAVGAAASETKLFLNVSI